MEHVRGCSFNDRQSVTIVYLIVAVIFVWIPKSACEVETRMETQFKKCCGLGTSWASEGLRCEKFTGPVSGVPRVEQGLCLEAVDICCVRAFREKSCELGKKDARAGKACVQGQKSKNAPCPGDQQRDCCEGCKLGILTGSMGQGCAFKSFAFGKPWDPAFLECCHEASPTTTNTDTDATYSTPAFTTDTTTNVTQTSDTTSSATSTTSETDETFPDIPTPALEDLCQLMKGLLCSDICVPTSGSFYCKCPEGSILLEDGKTCRNNSPEDRCKTKNPCAHVCNDTGSELICSCNPGFVLAEDGHACEPMSSRLGEPTDEDIDFDARCPAGYKYNETNQVCDDIDECEDNPCSGECKNVAGSFVCLPNYGSVDDNKNVAQESCPPGYQWNSQIQQCADIDECLDSTEACNQDTHVCVNTHGSFTCHELNGPKTCPAGFKFDVEAKICRDVDECAEGIDGCMPTIEECRNTEGAYECDVKCGRGFVYDRREDMCLDLDECAETSNPCNDPDTRCVNNAGGYDCKKIEILEQSSTNDFSGMKILTESPMSLNRERSMENNVESSEVTMRKETRERSQFEYRKKNDRLSMNDRDYMEHNSTRASTTMENSSMRNCPADYFYNVEKGWCECRNGLRLDSTTGQCRDPPSTTTRLTTASFTTEPEPCLPGYKRDPSGDCTDINECRDGPGCNYDELCHNLLGDYDCSPICKSGYKYENSTLTCTDIDECSLDLHDCPRGTHRCVNANGTYTCEKLADCAKGYRRTSKGDCSDIDECSEGPGCREHERCVNLAGTYDCSPLCGTGWHFDSPTKGCLDVDECQLGRHDCPQITHRCQNTNGSYNCQLIPPCTSGFRKLFNGSCIDIDECAENLHDCSLMYHRYCVNREGTYECVTRYPECPKGYEYSLRTKNCVDIDECAKGDYHCDTKYSERCVNLPGSYKCDGPFATNIYQRQRPACPSGYRYDYARRQCTDIDECAEETHSCGHEVCYNQPGGYTCARAPKPLPAKPRTTLATATQNQRCQPGSKFLRNRGCVDVDECQEDPEACTSNERCVNTPGSFVCECKIGFRRDDLTRACVDINECQLPNNDCLSTQRCDNTLGSYNCVRYLPCGTGYTLNAATEICEDDDECVLGTHDCSGGYHCRNTLGSYRCDRNPRITPTPRAAPSTARMTATTTTPRTTMVEVGPAVSCPRGFVTGPRGQCVDVDECQLNPNPCARSSQKCLNTMGSYRCVSRLRCGNGYNLDPSGTRCIDVDECTEGTHQCETGQICQNRPGGYTCKCPPGHRLGPNKECIDIDECSLYAGENFGGVCGQNSRCDNTPGSYRCTCDSGFETVSTGQGQEICQDIDECVKTPGLCQQNCLNAWGSYRCSCRPGFRLNSDNRSCTDIDECTEFKNNNLCIGICDNTPGSYACSCPAGYKLGADERTCQDIDECASGRVCRDPNEMCQNTRGSYRCNKIECPTGYYRDRERMNRCLRISRYCPSGDLACFRAPSHFSYNFITFVSMIPIPTTGQLELFTMRSTHPPGSTVQFSMALVDARGPPGVTRVTESSFALRRPGPSQAVLVLTESIGGPQEIELDLTMEIYHDTAFAGSAVAKLLIFVSQYEY